MMCPLKEQDTESPLQRTVRKYYLNLTLMEEDLTAGVLISLVVFQELQASLQETFRPDSDADLISLNVSGRRAYRMRSDF